MRPFSAAHACANAVLPEKLTGAVSWSKTDTRSEGTGMMNATWGVSQVYFLDSIIAKLPNVNFSNFFLLASSLGAASLYLSPHSASRAVSLVRPGL